MISWDGHTKLYRGLGSSLFRESSASNNEYFEMFLSLNSFKYSSSQLYSQETDLISLAFPYDLSS